MQLETKAQLAKVTLSLLTLLATLLFLGVLVLVLCVGLGINPFKETTTSFLLTGFAGLTGVAGVLVFLNVATNVNLIADAKIAELKIEARPGIWKKWLAGFLAAAIALALLVALGTYFSKQRYMAVVHTQADDVLKENSNLVEEIGRLLTADRPEDYKRIGDIRAFLQNQRAGLPQLTVIYSGRFEDKLAFYKIPDYFPQDNSGKFIYTPTYFQCTQGLDCEYLAGFFSGKSVNELEKYTIRDDQFYIFIPVTRSQARFVLLFNRENSYGKLGS